MPAIHVDPGAAGTRLRAYCPLLRSSSQRHSPAIWCYRDRHDPLAVVELGKCADVVLLACSGSEKDVPVDKAGAMGLQTLMALGLPPVIALVAPSVNHASKAAALSLKVRVPWVRESGPWRLGPIRPMPCPLLLPRTGQLPRST